MSVPVPGPGSAESVPAWVSPAQQDAARAASIESVLPGVDGVASVFPPAGAEFSGLVPKSVRVTDELVEVHIIAEYGRPFQATADSVDRAIQPLLDGRNLQIVVADILLPGEVLPELQLAPETVAHAPIERPESAAADASGSGSAGERESDGGSHAEADSAKAATDRGVQSDEESQQTPVTEIKVDTAADAAAEVTVPGQPEVEIRIGVKPADPADPAQDSTSDRDASGTASV